MKKAILCSIVTFLVMFLATSCDREDILEQEAVDSFNEESVFNDLNLVKALLGRA